MTLLNAADAKKSQSPELVKPFVATPEHISQFLEIKTDEVRTKMESVEGRKELFGQLMEHKEALAKMHPTFNPDDLKRQLEVAGATLSAKDRFVKSQQSPEKKGMFRRAWDAIKSFPKKHPVVTAVLALAAVAGIGAAIAYYSGLIEIAFQKVGEGAAVGIGRAISHLPVDPGGADAGSALTFGIQ